MTQIFPTGPFSFRGEQAFSRALLHGLVQEKYADVDRVWLVQDPDHYEILLRFKTHIDGIPRTRKLKARVYRADRDENWFQTKATVSHVVDLMLLDLRDDNGLWKVARDENSTGESALVVYQDGELRA